MKYLLDTNTCIHYLNHLDSPVRHRLERLHPADVTLCSMVKAELYYGAVKSKQTAKNLAALDYLFTTLSFPTHPPVIPDSPHCHFEE